MRLCVRLTYWIPPRDAVRGELGVRTARGPTLFNRQLSDDTATASRRGRPRSEKTRLAILDAAADLLLANGTANTTVEAIAERARVSKVTHLQVVAQPRRIGD